MLLYITQSILRVLRVYSCIWKKKKKKKKAFAFRFNQVLMACSLSMVQYQF